MFADALRHCVSELTAEQIAQMEDEHLIIRHGRQIVLRPDRLAKLVRRDITSDDPVN